MALSTIGGPVATFKPQPEKDFQFEGCPAFPIELVTLYKSSIYIPDCDGKTAPATINALLD